MVIKQMAQIKISKNFLKNAKEILNLIKKSNPIIIHRHINPDGDALGSQWGLKTLIEENFRNKKVLVPGDMTEYMLKFFPPAMIVNSKDYENALVIVCDTANRERISGQFWQTAKNIIKIDHHPEVDNYGTLNLVESSAVAACQVVAKWAKMMKLKLSNDAARYLFFGLVTDSGRFMYRSVNNETFDIASFLVATNFSLLDLYEKLYLQDLKTTRIKGYILNNFQVTKNGVAYIIVTKETLKKLEQQLNQQLTEDKEKITILQEDITSQVNLMANIATIKIWFIACQSEIDNEFKISIRSARWTINQLAVKFGGGGHKYAAGVKVKNLSIVENLLHDLDNLANSEPNVK
ncbi:MAG: bifunctional oligoribonuclease/PAP phosphatase NrnA [Spiroplasma sp.]|nr:bifunctional oligoribonuclease/PAP phosphatase NrnA [Spiroplasma sp.]